MPSPNPLGNNPVTPPDSSDAVGGFFLRTIKGWVTRQALKYIGVATAATAAWLAAKTGNQDASSSVASALGVLLTSIVSLGIESALSYKAHNLQSESK